MGRIIILNLDILTLTSAGTLIWTFFKSLDIYLNRPHDK